MLFRSVGPMVAEQGDYWPAADGPHGSLAGERLTPAALETFRRALQLMESARIEAARAAIRPLEESARPPAGVRLTLAALLADSGDTRAARRQLDPLLDKYHDDGRLWFMAGQLAERCQEVEQAIDCYRHGMRCPGQSPCWCAERLAAVYLMSGDLPLARDALVWLADALPHEFNVRAELASVLVLLGDYSRAVAAYQDAILIEPDDWQVHGDMAAALEAGQCWSEALEAYRRVLRDRPHFADVQLKAAKVCGRLGFHAEALEHITAALETNPRYLEAIVFQGLLLTELHQRQAALASFRRAIDVNDQYVAAYVAMAWALQQMGQENQAAETMDLACKIAPGSEQIYARLSQVGLEAALEDPNPPLCDADICGGLRRAAVLQMQDDGVQDVAPDDEEPAEQSADAALAGRDHDLLLNRQLDAHRQAVIDCPHYADVRYRYGLLLASLGRSDEAIEQYTAAIEINPHYVEALVRLALAAWQSNHVEQAHDALKRVWELAPDQLRGHYGFGVAWADRGLWPLTVQAAHRGGAGESPEVLDQAGRVALLNLGAGDARRRAWMASLQLVDLRDRGLLNSPAAEN